MFARSEGNPFFTEELLAVVRAGSGDLPATLRDLLRGRVQTLPGPARQLLAVVAVAGRQVSHRLLVAVAGLDDHQLIQALQTAVGSQLLVTMAGEDGYEVRHALLREVVEADLLPGEHWFRAGSGWSRGIAPESGICHRSALVSSLSLRIWPYGCRSTPAGRGG